MTKVSVVVATYNSGERLGAAVTSLDRQSMRPDEFEVIFVDDGSTDGTPERLARVAAGRPNVRWCGIENSGWPGRPRNVGTRLARGEFVLYLDHDDELFPEALERMYRYGVAHGSDVVIGKEIRSGGSAINAALFSRNQPRVALGGTLFSLLTPHKLYRREFLLDHGIWFPEGRRRIEDHLFNARVYLAGAAVSALADYPCYKWVIHSDGSNNSRQRIDQQGYWRNVAEVLDVVEANTEPGPVRDAIMMKWYRGRMVWFARHFATWPVSQRREAMAAMRAAMTRFPEHLDAQLSAAHRARVRLVRLGDHAGLHRVAALDEGVRLDARAERYFWDDGVLTVHIVGVIVDGSGRPYPIHRDGERVVRTVPAGLDHLIRAADRDLTAEIPAIRPSMGIRHHAAGIDWTVPCTGHVALVERDGVLTIEVRTVGRVDPATAAFGAALDEGVWDVTVSTTGMGYGLTSPVTVTGHSARPALVDGRPVVAYPTGHGTLAVDIGQHVRTVVGDAGLTVGDVRAVRAGPEADLTIGLPRVPVRGRASLDGQLVLGARAFAARLCADDTGAVVTCRVTPPERPARISLRLRTREVRTDLILRPDPDTGVVVTRARRTPTPAVWRAVRRLRNRVRLRSRLRGLARRVLRALPAHWR